MDQRTDEWYQARLGKATASRVADLTARTKTGWGAGRANMIATLVAERLTGLPQDTFTNGAMQWGIEHEDDAIAAYEFLHGEAVERVGFVDHPTIKWSGASPDGLVGDGLIEVKCPNTATHLEFLRYGKIPEKYRKQMLWQMECTEREWCDFASYDPRMPPHLQLKVVRFGRDSVALADLRDGVLSALIEVSKIIEELEQ